MRPDIAQAIHDAAVSSKQPYMGAIETTLLNCVFMSAWEFVETTRDHGAFHTWLFGNEGRTYMLLVAEALS